MFANIRHFHPSPIFGGKAGSQPLELSPIRTTALPSNPRLGWKWLTVATTPFYYDMEKVTAMKFFIVQALWVKKNCFNQNLQQTLVTALDLELGWP